MLNNEKTISPETNIDSQELQHSWVLAASILLSVFAAQFISDERLGLNYVLFSALCLTAMIMLRKHFQQEITKNEYLLLLSATSISVCFIFRQSDALYGLNLLAIFMLLWIAYAQRYTGSFSNIPMIAWLLTPFRFLRLCWFSSFRLISIGLTSSLFLTRQQKQIRSIILGIFWSMPVLLILGSLLVSSDSRFEQFTMNIFSLDFFELLDELLNIILYFPLLSAFFYATTLLTLGGTDVKIVENKEVAYHLESVQVLTVLTLINILFLSYISIQFSYFFGGEKIILESSSLTYSAYARRGFWELIFLAMIVLPILLIAHWLQHQEQNSLQIWFSRLAVFMVICIVIIEASAIHRMYLYVKIYGLTELRFYSSLFMLYMMAGLITFCLTVLKNKRGQFIVTMVSQAIVVILLLNIINPDAQISSYNISNYHNGSIDTNYLKKLSLDAYPTIYSKRDSFNQASSCLLQSQLKSKLKKFNTKWYQWNWSIEQAYQVIEHWQEQCKSNNRPATTAK